MRVFVHKKNGYCHCMLHRRRRRIASKHHILIIMCNPRVLGYIHIYICAVALGAETTAKKLSHNARLHAVIIIQNTRDSADAHSSPR